MAGAHNPARGAHLEFGEFPNGTPRFVSAGFKLLDHALDAARDLEGRGYAPNRISAFMATATRDRYVDTHPRYGEFERRAAAVGPVAVERRSGGSERSAAGGAAVVALGTTPVAPPLGIVLSGPVADLLSALGERTAGGIVGAMVAAGMSEHGARQFKRSIDEGRVVVGVTADTLPERAHITEILARHGGDLAPSDARRLVGD